MTESMSQEDHEEDHEEAEAEQKSAKPSIETSSPHGRTVMNSPRNLGERSMEKCTSCRQKKIKCFPVTRQWPQKCQPCQKSGLLCGPNSRFATRIEVEKTSASTPASNAKASTYTDQEWEEMKEHFRQSYIVENRPLKDVAILMEQMYGFNASNRQWERKKDRWGYVKYGKRKRDNRQSSTENHAAGVLVERNHSRKSRRSDQISAGVDRSRSSSVSSQYTQAQDNFTPSTVSGMADTPADTESSPEQLHEVDTVRVSEIRDFSNLDPRSQIPLTRKNNIRLVNLLPGDGDLLSLTMYLGTFENSYEAISYSWGDQHDMMDIEVFVNGSQSFFPVTRTLGCALNILRKRGELRTLWIDALCINQADVAERNSHAFKMGNIFENATCVLVWLGPQTTYSKLAFDFIHRITQVAQFEELIEDQGASEKWKAFAILAKQSYWRRAWTLQELAFSRRTILRWGGLEAPFDLLVDALSIISKLNNRLRKNFELSATFKQIADFPERIKTLSAAYFVRISYQIVRRGEDCKILEYLQPLESLLMSSISLESVDPRDKVYSLLRLSNDVKPKCAGEHADVDGCEDVEKDAQEQTLMIDYQKPVFDVYKEVMGSLIFKSGSLDIICQSWAPDAENLPSWIKTSSFSSFAVDNDGEYQRQQADPFVGKQRLGMKSYAASRNSKATVRFGEGEQERTLFVKGFRLESIISVAEIAHYGRIPQVWGDFGGWTNMNEQPPEPFWKTLVADRSFGGIGAPPRYFGHACQAIFSKATPSGDIDIPKLLLNNSCTALLAEFVRRVQSVIWNRRLVMSRKGHLGLTSQFAEKGDIVCIFYGCSVPILIRPIKQDINDSKFYGQLYTVIGECYLHGMMNGEAMKYQDSMGLNEEFFALV